MQALLLFVNSVPRSTYSMPCRNMLYTKRASLAAFAFTAKAGRPSPEPSELRSQNMSCLPHGTGGEVLFVSAQIFESFREAQCHSSVNSATGANIFASFRACPII